MTKLNFLLALEKELSGLPQEDREQHLTFYCEMIEDRVEEGIPEEEAVAQIGAIEEIAAQIHAEHTVEEPVTEEEKPETEEVQTKRRMKPWEIVLLALGSPVWLSLLIAVLAVAFSLVVSLWAAVVSLWAVFVSLAACAAALPVAAVYFICIDYTAAALPVAAVYFICIDYTLSGLAVIGTSLVCGGLAILFFYGCKLATKGMALLTKISVIALRNCFRRREKA